MLLKKIMMGLVLFLALIACSSYSFSAEYDPGWTSFIFGSGLLPGSDHGVPTTPWYEVLPWEVAFCSYFGGNDPSVFTSDPSTTGEYYHNLMLTLQAQVSSPLAGDVPVSSTTRIYEVAYFVQPTQSDETVNFEVQVFTDTGEMTSIASGSSNYVNGYRDFWAETSEKNYTKAKILYNNQRRNGEFEVEFVEQFS
jgi:hypothetical protein